MLSNELEYCLNDAFQRARDARHEFITVEHLLLAMLDTPPVVEILQACGADLVRLAPRAQGIHRRIDAAAARRRRRRVDGRAADARLSARVAARGVSRAVERQKEVTPANVLVAIFSEKQSHAVYLLGLQDVGRLDVVNYVSHGVPKIPEAKPRERGRQRGASAPARAAVRSRSSPRNLNALAAGGQDRSADRPAARGRAHDRRSCAAAARTTRCTSAKPASARPRSPRASRA